MIRQNTFWKAPANLKGKINFGDEITPLTEIYHRNNYEFILPFQL